MLRISQTCQYPSKQAWCSSEPVQEEAHLQRAHLHLSAHQVLSEHALVQDACKHRQGHLPAVCSIFQANGGQLR